MSAILRPYVHSKKTCSSFQKQLDYDKDKQYRALAYDCCFEILESQTWGQKFDERRKNLDKNTGRRFYHFVISPDPKEDATLDQLRELATTWVNNHFEFEQWIITYHNDTDILHAHVVVNAVRKNGSKIRFSFKDWINLHFDLQEVAKEVGFTLPAPKSYYDQYREYVKKESEFD